MPRNTQKKEFYLGNEALPTPDAQFNYAEHPEWIADIQKCRKNILYFAEQFFYITNLDEGKIKIKLRPFQKRILRSLRDNRFVCLLASRQIGKALALDTPIPTPKGWITMGEIKDGDEIYGMDGKVCNVVKAHDILQNRDCYEVVFDNDEKIIADEDHLWFTQTRKERSKNINGSKKTTKQIFETLLTGSLRKKEPNHRIPTCINGIETSFKDLPIDPYTLGLWLGDGASEGGTITVGLRDINDIVDILTNQQTQFDKLTLHNYNKDVFTLRISVSENKKTKSLNTLLKENNLVFNKHIPEQYFRSSRDQRLALLQGLIDSDGYVNKTGVAQFYNTNLNLVNQVRSLIESLGYKVTQKEFIPKLKNIECTKVGVLTFTPIEYVCRLGFKRNRIKCKEFINNTKLRTQWHYIKDIKPVESVPVRCITVDNETGTFLCGKQFIPTSNTTLMTIYALWVSCFYEDQRILIVANKEQTAISIFKRVRTAYEKLPNYLKPGAIEYGKTSMSLGNGSSIGISTTSSDAGRGDSCNCLILDELAFIDNHLVTDFWKSVYPIISSSKKSKIFVASTPNGTGNLFYDLYSGATEKKNGWHPERVDWWEVPGRDEKWKENTIRELGSREFFDQEFGNVFLQTGESAVNERLFDELKSECLEPTFVFDEGHYLLWEEPNDKQIYVAGVDVSEGVGEAASVIQILDITNLREIKQVAVYHNRNISPINFTTKLHEILQHWGSPLALIERNNCGAQVVDQLKHTLQYENIVSYGAKAGKLDFNKPGVVAHTNTKYKGVTNMRYWTNELKCLKIRDIKTLIELKGFVRYANGTWGAKPGGDSWDDRVMSLIWALMILDNDVVERYFEIEQYDDNKRPQLLKALDYGIKYFINPTSMYNNEKYNENSTAVLPILFQGNQEDNFSEVSDLETQGWRFL